MVNIDFHKHTGRGGSSLPRGAGTEIQNSAS